MYWVLVLVRGASVKDMREDSSSRLASWLAFGFEEIVSSAVCVVVCSGSGDTLRLVSNGEIILFFESADVGMTRD